VFIVERHSERILVLKMVLGDRLLNVFTVYAPHSGKPDEEKECFWNEVFHLVNCIPQNEMVVFAGDMNGHVGSSRMDEMRAVLKKMKSPRIVGAGNRNDTSHRRYWNPVDIRFM